MNLGVATVPWAIVVQLPIRIVSEKNERNRWGRIRRTQSQREFTRMAVRARWLQQSLTPPLVVTLTRIAPRLIDSDNSIGGLSAVRDGVARAIGLDDGPRSPVRWNYAQRQSNKCSPLKYGVEILIEERRVP